MINGERSSPFKVTRGVHQGDPMFCLLFNMAIEQRLTRTIRQFIWGGASHPTVGLETLSKSIKQGGKKLLDLRIRNDAIKLMKVKRYLNLSKTRPTWAKVADSLMKMNLNKRWRVEDDRAYQNVFLQMLTIYSREREEGLPHTLRKMITTAQKYKVALLPKGMKPRMKLNMPM